MAQILLAKYTLGSPLRLICVDTRAGAYVTYLRDSGYLDFMPSVQPTPEPGNVVVETLEVVDGKIVQSWHIVDE